MSRRCSRWLPVLGGAWLLLAAPALAWGQDQDDSSFSDHERRTAQAFIEGLRARGYHDLALDYIERLRDDPQTTAEQRATLDYEIGRGMLEEATSLDDLDRRRDLLEQARAQLDAFVQANPEHEQADRALSQIARMLFERGITAALQASEIDPESVDNDARKAELQRSRETFLAEARASFRDARPAYDRAIERLTAAYESFDKALHDEADQPEREKRDQVQAAMLDARLQRALLDYEDAQTYPPDDPQRNALLDTAIERFRSLYDNYRSRVAGFFAHMWAGKCYEEQGKLSEASGIYKELLEQPNAELAPLKRKVAYFQILIDAKRGDHALAVRRASEWLQMYPNAIQTDEGTGVRFELAKNLLAQLPKVSPREQTAYTRQAVELLTDVVRYYSPFKPEAVELLRAHKPSAAMQAEQVTRMTFEEASAEAESALQTGDWDRAILLLRHAIRQANPNRRVDEANRARYLLAYAAYMGSRYYDAAVLADHLVRHYPQAGLSDKAAEIGLASLTMAYNANDLRGDRASDLQRLIDLAELVASTYPEASQGDAARFLLGEVALGRGRYEEASRTFETVREGSPRRLDALVKSGDAHWRHALALRRDNRAAEADAESKAARGLMENALQARQEARTPATDPGYIANANALAEIHRAEDRPEEAIALLAPIVEALGGGDASEELAPLRISTLTILLRSHIAAGDADAAILDMAALEKAGAQGAVLTQLYYFLGQSLQRELEALDASANPLSAARATQIREAYSRFLEALTTSEAGQTYDSLMFAGEALLKLGEAERAFAIFDRVLANHGEEAEFQAPGDRRLLRTRLRRAEALRKQGRLDTARVALEEINRTDGSLLDTQMERGYLLEDLARAAVEDDRAQAAAHWKAAYDHWLALSGKLKGGRPRRIEYYEALYQLAVALEGMNQSKKAVATLKGVMTLSPSVGNPEMKARYEEFLSRLER